MECHGGRAAERAQPRAGNSHEPSRAANAPSQDGEQRSDCEEDPAAECRDVPRLKAPDAKRGPSFVASRLAEEPPRLTFHIPRRNKEKRGAFILPSSLRSQWLGLFAVSENKHGGSRHVLFLFRQPSLVVLKNIYRMGCKHVPQE